MKSKTAAAIGIVLALICCAVGGLWHMENYETVYYTRIDNTKVHEIAATDDMRYEYALDCYNKDGNKKQLKFKTSRILREDAYLLLEVRAFGVHSWEEVQPEDLPPRTLEKLK